MIDPGSSREIDRAPSHEIGPFTGRTRCGSVAASSASGSRAGSLGASGFGNGRAAHDFGYDDACSAQRWTLPTPWSDTVFRNSAVIRCMNDQDEQRLLEAVSRGDERAFEEIYGLFSGRVRLAAWRVSHRSDWLDEIVNEAWYRAFQNRKSYNASKPFLYWMAGIVQNVYREHCRKSPLTLSAGSPDPTKIRLDEVTPEQLADEAETLSGLNDCVSRLSAEDQALVRLRFFDNKSLRDVASEIGVPESTVRETRIPAVLDALKRCLSAKGLRFSHIFPAQGGDEMQ